MTGTGFLAQGVTTIRTRRQNLRRTAHMLTALAGAALSLTAAIVIIGKVTGQGWQLPDIRTRALVVGAGGGGALIDVDASTVDHAQFPLTIELPDQIQLTPALLVAAPLFAVWLWLQHRVFQLRRHPGLDRHRGLASIKDIRGKYGRRRVRASGIYTLPGTTRWQRMLLPTTAFGYRFGTPYRPRSRLRLWFDFEARVRIVARTGWGKSWRLLIPMIRQLPGPAVITSVEPEIFNATARARMWRQPPVRWEWMRRLRPAWRTAVRYPVYVADLSAPETRMAAGFDQVRWNPIVGCENYKTATNRARALVSGGDTDSGGDFGSSTDKFFRDSATQVLAAWLHALALDPRTDIEDLVEWLRDTDLNTPGVTLERQTGAAYAAARAAIMNMNVHLDPAAGRTTSGVRRYLNFAISSLSSGQGRTLCGNRHEQQLDIEQLIRDNGTVYLLAEVDEMDTARPLLTLFAQEMFMAAERTARTMPKRRLPQPFMGVFDELYSGVRLPILPYVASVQRKYGISFAYAIQSSSDEEAMYGKSGAQRLRAQTHTIIGGHDPDTATETTRRAGRAPAVIAGRGQAGHHTEQVQTDDVLPESDQQQLQDGQSIVLGPGLRPFLAHVKRADQRRAKAQEIQCEIRTVQGFVVSQCNTDLVAPALAVQASSVSADIEFR